MRFLLAVLAGTILVLDCAAQSGVTDGKSAADTLVVPADRMLILRPFLLPDPLLFLLDGSPVDSTHFSADLRFGRIQLDSSINPGDTVVVRFTALPLTFADVYRSELDAVGSPTAGTGAEPPIPVGRRADVGSQSTGAADDFFGSPRLRKSGSITRGVIAGNNQDATIESGLRMQLSGEIVDGVNLRAVLTDENTPILPEGTTQRINEFDRVFIEVSSRRGTAQLGDFDLNLSNAEFAQFSRKLQGAKVEGNLPAATSAFAGGTVTAAGATSRGTFRSQEIQGVEGVQGAYRLEGASGERFIIVVPGTETLYVDGRRMTRGETNDYVIDYATAEITFTARQLITANKRIVVEFQYSTNQFTRSLLASSAEARFGSESKEAGRVSVTVIREADSKEFNEEFGLTSADSVLLAESGDGVAARSGAEVVTFDPEAAFVQYVREPRSLPDGTMDSVFVAVTAAPAAGVPVYRVQFTRLGSGSGSYVRTGQSVNGILYEFRGPGLGDYEPVRILPKPRLQQVVDLSGEVRPLGPLRLFGEWATSTNNLNRLSTLDSSDDKGQAYTIGLRAPDMRLGLGGILVSAELRRRFVHADFRSFNRIRPVEFGRRWNLDTRTADVAGGNSLNAGETTDEISTQVQFSDGSSLEGEWGSIRLGDAFEAVRRAGSFELREPGWPSVEFNSEYITSTDRGLRRKGKWIRQNGVVRYPELVWHLTPALEIEQEDRRQRDIDADSLTDASLAFVELRPSLAFGTETVTIGAGIDWRNEQFVLDGDLRDAARGSTVKAFFSYKAGSLFSTDGNVGFRRRQFRDAFRIRQTRQNSESVVLAWKGSFRPWQRAVDASWFYEAQTERTPKLQEIYVRTGPELGQFVWNDDNGDGAIQIDEFVPETTPNEGIYVKTFVPSDTLFSIIGVQARIRLGLDPDRKWRTASESWKRVLSLVSTRTTLEVVEKSQEQDLKQVYLLNLHRFRKPGKTLNGRLAVRQEVSLFKRNPDLGVDALFSQIRSLTDLAAGLEERFINMWQLSASVRPVRRITTRITGSTEISRVESESFVSRQYNLRTVRLSPEISYSPSRSWQFKVQLDLANKDDRRFERSARILKVPLEVRHNRARKLQITGRFELADVRLDGTADGFAQFELTDGRGPGTSMLWSGGAQYSINQFIRASFSYDGRAPANAPTLHTLRMQISAIF